jgi:hypothetical protein
LLLTIDWQAYIQNLETSRMKLARMEQELHRARQQQQHAVYAAGASSSSSQVGLPLPSSFDPGQLLLLRIQSCILAIELT